MVDNRGEDGVTRFLGSVLFVRMRNS
jgi:hypothetical protein